MTFQEWQEQLAAWGDVFFGGWSIGFGLSFFIWQVGYMARVATEFLRSR